MTKLSLSIVIGNIFKEGFEKFSRLNPLAMARRV